MANAMSDINGAGPGFPDWMLDQHSEDDPAVNGGLNENSLIVGGNLTEPHTWRGLAPHELCSMHITTRPAGLTTEG